MAAFQETDVDSARSLDLRSYMGPVTGFWSVTWWVGVRTTEAGSGISMDMTGVDILGNAISETGGTLDGSGASTGGRVAEFLVNISDSGALTFDIGIFSPGGVLRYDYTVWITQPQGNS